MLKIPIREAVTASAPDAQSHTPSEEAGVPQISGRKYLQRRGGLRLSAHRSGFSLIEVVIAIGIFLFGALAIVRIFPSSISAIQTSEQRNVGQRMAQTTLSRYTISPLSVPEAITDVDPQIATTANPTGWSDFPGAPYGSGTRNESLPREPAAADDISFDNSQTLSTQIVKSAAGRFRRVLGEGHVAGSGNIRLRFPYLNINVQANLNTVRAYRKIEVQGVTIDQNGALNFENATVGGSSFNDAVSAFPTRPPSTSVAGAPYDARGRDFTPFYVSYRWRQRMSGALSGPGASADPRYDRINGVGDEEKLFPARNTGWTTTSDRIARAVLPSNIASGDPDRIVSGPVRVWFLSPLPVADVQPTDEISRVGFIKVANVAATDTVYFDYTVPDWRFLVVDDQLSGISRDDQKYLDQRGYTDPNLLPLQVVAPTRYILDDQISSAAAKDGGAQLYTLLTGENTVPSISFWSPDKFPAANSSGQPGQEPDNLENQAPVPPFKALAVRPKTGQVFFNTQAGTNTIQAPRVRLVYRNLDGWLQQPSVAARSYVAYESALSVARTEHPREPWREYVWNYSDDALYFHPSEAGKTVLATYQYKVGTDPAVAPVTMRDVPITLRDNTVDEPTAKESASLFDGFSLKPNTNVGNTVQSARAYFIDNAGRCIGTAAENDTDVLSTKGTPNDGARIVAIQSIRGASVRVRSAWFSQGRYSQTDVAGYRSLDVESNTRS